MMMGLPLGLRCYLWAVYLACLGLVTTAAASFVAVGAVSRPSLVLLQGVAVFILLAYAGERTTLQVSGAVVVVGADVPPHTAARAGRQRHGHPRGRCMAL